MAARLMAANNPTRSKVNLIVIAVLSSAFAVYGFVNFNEEIGTEYRNAPGWLFGGLRLALALTACSYIVKMMRGQSIED